MGRATRVGFDPGRQRPGPMADGRHCALTGAPIVAVGAGIVGESVAAHLSRRGGRPVVVLERREDPEREATARPSLGFSADRRERDTGLAQALRQAVLQRAPRDWPGALGAHTEVLHLATTRDAVETVGESFSGEAP